MHIAPFFAHLLIWLSAAMVPLETLPATDCGLAAGRAIAGAGVRATRGCCGGCCRTAGPTCPLCKKAAAERGCCKCKVCTCRELASGNSATPVSGNSQPAKTLLCQLPGVVCAAAAGAFSPGLSLLEGAEGLPLSSLERCSTLCRFVI